MGKKVKLTFILGIPVLVFNPSLPTNSHGISTLLLLSYLPASKSADKIALSKWQGLLQHPFQEFCPEQGVKCYVKRTKI